MPRGELLAPLIEDFLITYHKMRSGAMARPHLHNRYEMFLCLSDGILCLIGERVFTLNAGTLVLFDYNCLHKVTVPPGRLYERYVINFSRGMFEGFSAECAPLLSCFAGGYAVLPLSGPKLKRILDLFTDMRALYWQSDRPMLRIKLLLAQLLLEISELRALGRIPAPGRDTGMEPVLCYICAHIEEKLTIDMLCAAFYVSRSTLTARFKAATGVTVNGYIAALRLSRAAELLKKGMGIPAVCRACGFADQSHFTRAFSARFGCPPGRYARTPAPGPSRPNI